MMFVFRILLFGLMLALPLSMSLTSCSDTDNQMDISGYWSGESKNSTTKKSWDIDLYIDQDDGDILAIYSDYRGSITLRNVTYDGNHLSFLLDIYPEVVTFYGEIESAYEISGTWSFSGDENNGTWFIINTDQNENNESENTPTPVQGEDSSENPFSM